jgi:hypothetical protein
MQVKTKSFGLCNLVVRNYSNQRTAISLIDSHDGSAIGTLTVNLPDEPLNEGEFFVKTWSENSGIAQDCLNSGLFINTGRIVKTGWVEAQVWKFK